MHVSRHRDDISSAAAGLRPEGAAAPGHNKSRLHSLYLTISPLFPVAASPEPIRSLKHCNCPHLLSTSKTAQHVRPLGLRPVTISGFFSCLRCFLWSTIAPGATRTAQNSRAFAHCMWVFHRFHLCVSLASFKTLRRWTIFILLYYLVVLIVEAGPGCYL